VKADTRITELSGGEKARLLMGLATFNGPSMVILDEPTNHLDIDSRAALIDAINEYEGAVILVSHDRRLLEACADRLWLVANGTVKSFDGDMEDYQRYVLDMARGSEGSGQKAKDALKPATEAPKREPTRTRKDAQPLRKKIEAVEDRIQKFEALMQRIDATLAKPDVFTKDPAKAGQLAQQRSELERALARAEAEWLELSNEYDEAMAN
jgi:ATP-binding cassette subfamily F protein 3